MEQFLQSVEAHPGATFGICIFILLALSVISEIVGNIFNRK